MTKPTSMTTFLRENKTLMVVIAVGLFLLELEIFAIAAMKSGRESTLEIRDNSGNLIHVADGDQLSSFDKYYFEETFGPMDQYQTNLVTKERPFPFRAWFAAAMGLPIGAMLLFGFVIRAYRALFYDEPGGKDQESTTDDPVNQAQNRLERTVSRISRLNIFVLGVLIFLAIAAYWIVPNVITYVGKASLENIVKYKWVFIPVAIAIAAIVLWIIYLRYLLAKKNIEAQTELHKYQIQLEMGMASDPARQLTDGTTGTEKLPSPEGWIEGELETGTKAPSKKGGI